jgi:hypothetical protein
MDMDIGMIERSWHYYQITIRIGNYISFGVCELKVSSVVHHFDATNIFPYVVCPCTAYFYKVYYSVWSTFTQWG